MKRILIVGVGALGSAIAKSALRSGVDKAALLLVDRTPVEASHTTDELQGCRVEGQVPENLSLGAGDFVVLAVKPQDAESACSGLQRVLSSEAIVISVLAGVTVARLQSFLGHSKVIRAMPNLGATVGQSATAYFASSDIEDSELDSIEGFLACIGRSWRVENEKLIDAATAVAGSGPAYICWLSEQMEYVANELGIPQQECRALVLQTLKATTAYLENSDHSFAQLRTRVTSPGGTTAAALSILEQREAAESVRDAVRAAFKRAEQLSQ